MRTEDSVIMSSRQMNKSQAIKIIVVGVGAPAFIKVYAEKYPTVEFIPAENPPEDRSIPHVFVDEQLQLSKNIRDEFTPPRPARLDQDPEDMSNNPRNRHERRALARLSRRAAQR